MTNSKFLYICVFALISGCASSGYKEFYKPTNSEILEKTYKNRLSPPPQNPLVERISGNGDVRSIFDKFYKAGYIYIGESTFNSGTPEKDIAAIKQGKEVFADLVVIINPKYTGSTSSVIPITTPTTTTSFSTANATAYGSGGLVNAYGSGTTTTYGSTTSMIPITIHRVDYAAIYFVKVKPHFGVYLRDLNDDEKKILQSNKGAAIHLVIDDSPAFKSDLLSGDIITAIDDIQIDGQKSLLAHMSTLHNTNVNLKIVRDGKRISKVVELVD